MAFGHFYLLKIERGHLLERGIYCNEYGSLNFAYYESAGWEGWTTLCITGNIGVVLGIGPQIKKIKKVQKCWYCFKILRLFLEWI